LRDDISATVRPLRRSQRRSQKGVAAARTSAGQFIACRITSVSHRRSRDDLRWRGGSLPHAKVQATQANCFIRRGATMVKEIEVPQVRGGPPPRTRRLIMPSVARGDFYVNADEARHHLARNAVRPPSRRAPPLRARAGGRAGSRGLIQRFEFNYEPAKDLRRLPQGDAAF